jgi:chromosome segregation ATPase
VSQQKDQEIQRIARDYEASLESKRQLEAQSRSYADALSKKVQALHDLEIQQHQVAGELNLLKNKCERIAEENSELRRKMGQRDEELEESMRSKARFESELKDIRGALGRSSKNQELRALNELSMETLQLSQKVNEMRKVSNYLDGKTPLRS